MWTDLAAGTKPPDIQRNEVLLGEYEHGWQYYASKPLEDKTLEQLLHDLAPARRNAVSPGKARIHSCMGPFAAIWLLVCPTTAGLTIANDLLQCAVRRRLGIACSYDGPDPHGHSL